jgi:bifunctional non-homologous end joining protein LigD
LLAATYDDRRVLMDSLELDDPFWEVPPAYSDGEAALELSASSGQGRVVAKRRSRAACRQAQLGLGVKAVLTRDVILCGWHLGRGNGRAGSARSTVELITIRVSSGS